MDWRTVPRMRKGSTRCRASHVSCSRRESTFRTRSRTYPRLSLPFVSGEDGVGLGASGGLQAPLEQRGTAFIRDSSNQRSTPSPRAVGGLPPSRRPDMSFPTLSSTYMATAILVHYPCDTYDRATLEIYIRLYKLRSITGGTDDETRRAGGSSRSIGRTRTPRPPKAHFVHTPFCFPNPQRSDAPAPRTHYYPNVSTSLAPFDLNPGPPLLRLRPGSSPPPPPPPLASPPTAVVDALPPAASFQPASLAEDAPCHPPRTIPAESSSSRAAPTPTPLASPTADLHSPRSEFLASW